MPEKQAERILHPDQFVERGVYRFVVACPDHGKHQFKARFVAMHLFYDADDPPPRRPQLHIVVRRKIQGQMTGQAIPWKQIKECLRVD